jgi:hypothetical protein
MFDDTKMEKGIEAQGRAMNKPVDQKMVQNSFELNKGKAKQAGLNPSDPEYWSKVSGETSKDLGIFNKDNDKPLSFENKEESNGMFESYIPFEEELERVETKNGGDRDEHLQGMTKVEAGKKLCDYLKKLKVSRNEIIYSLVNRLILSVEVATAIVDGKKDDIGDIDNDWNPTDALSPGYNNSTPNAYSDITTLKDSSKKKSRRRNRRNKTYR